MFGNFKKSYYICLSIKLNLTTMKKNDKVWKPRSLWTHKHINKVFTDKKKESKKTGSFLVD